jgi:FkbM family methyltransferase
MVRPIGHRIDSVRDKINTVEHNNLSYYEALNKKLDAVQEQVLNNLKNRGFLKLSDTEILAKIFSGAKMYLDPRDVGLVPHLLLDGDWESDVTQAWLKTIQPKDVVLDIGANFGYFGLLAAQQANRDCTVVMFEANPNLIPYIEKTVMVNSLQNCSVVENLAVSNKKGSVQLNVLKDYIASSSILPVDKLNKYNQNGAKFEVAKSVKVPAVTVDEYCAEHGIKTLNVIKMDIEGYEEEAYAGMRKIIKASPDVTMFIEFTKQAYKSPKKFYNDMLEDFGAVYLIQPDGSITTPQETSYDRVVGTGEQWSMPVFSKKRFR